MPFVREVSFPMGSCRTALPPLTKRNTGKNEYLALGRRGSGRAPQWASREHPPLRFPPSSWSMLFHTSCHNVSTSGSHRHIHSLLGHLFFPGCLPFPYQWTLMSALMALGFRVPCPPKLTSLRQLTEQPERAHFCTRPCRSPCVPALGPRRSVSLSL